MWFPATMQLHEMIYTFLKTPLVQFSCFLETSISFFRSNLQNLLAIRKPTKVFFSWTPFLFFIWSLLKPNPYWRKDKKLIENTTTMVCKPGRLEIRDHRCTWVENPRGGGHGFPDKIARGSPILGLIAFFNMSHMWRHYKKPR